MKAIIKQYGGLIITVFAGVLIFTLLFAMPFPDGTGVIGEMATVSKKLITDNNVVVTDEMGNEIDKRNADKKAITEYTKRPYPVLLYDTSNPTLIAGEDFDIRNYMKVNIDGEERTLREGELKIELDKDSEYYSSYRWTDDDSSEDACRVFVNQIQKKEDEGDMSFYVKDQAGVITFYEPGIYYIFATVVDTASKKSQIKISIPVTN